jgi:hypothetical protein
MKTIDLNPTLPEMITTWAQAHPASFYSLSIVALAVVVTWWNN